MEIALFVILGCFALMCVHEYDKALKHGIYSEAAGEAQPFQERKSPLEGASAAS